MFLFIYRGTKSREADEAGIEGLSLHLRNVNEFWIQLYTQVSELSVLFHEHYTFSNPQVSRAKTNVTEKL